MIEKELPSPALLPRAWRETFTSYGVRYAPFVWGVLLVGLPLLLAWRWGTQFEDSVYPTLRYAYNLAVGRGWAYEAGIPGQVLPESPLFIGILALLASPATLPALSLALSALGWGATGLLLGYQRGRAPHRIAPRITALLLLSQPIVVLTLGGAAAWVIAAGYAAIWAWHHPETKTRTKTVTLLLLLLLQFDAATISLSLFLWLSPFWRERRLAGPAILLPLLGVGLWGAFLFNTFGRLMSPPDTAWQQQLTALFRQSQLYWLFLPFLVAGVVAAIRQPAQNGATLAWLVWGISAGVLGSSLTAPVLVMTGLILAALGAEVVWQWWTRQQPSLLTGYAAAAVIALLLFAQLISLRLAFLAQTDPSLSEEQLLDWLHENTAPDALLLASTRLGYLADRPTIPAYPLPQSDELFADLFKRVIAAAPSYLITTSTADWFPITGSGWVLDRYQAVADFTNPAAPNASYRVYGYLPSPFDNNAIQPATVIINENLKMVAYAYQPTYIQPGDDIYVTLYMEAMEPVGLGYFTRLHLTYTQDNWVWAWNQVLTPRSVAGSWWQPEQVIPERIKLEVEENIPWGAYELQVLWQRTYEEGPRPLYQNDDTNALDRVRLGYVVAVPPVDSTNLQPVNGRYGDQIQLRGFQLQGEQLPGNPLTVSLFWEALRVPDADYTVFVHLLNEAGEWVAGHDSVPMDGRYTTLAWQPGHLIQDDHILALPSDLPPGNYQIKVGLYRLETGERLPVWNAQNEEQPERSLFVTTLAVEP